MNIRNTPHLLTRDSHRAPPPPAVRFAGALSLATGRVHEICGMARRTLAFTVAGAMRGPVFWIAPTWTRGGPYPDGFSHLADPGRFTFVAPRRAEDLLWCMEEVLRAGVVPLVVADLPEPPGLTPIRRLHLAAESTIRKGGTREGGTAPLGLILTPEGGAQGIETRWSCDPRHGWRDGSRDGSRQGVRHVHMPGGQTDRPDPSGAAGQADPSGAAGQVAPSFGPDGGEGDAWHLNRLRDRSAPPAAWLLRDGGVVPLSADAAPPRGARPAAPAGPRA